MKHPVLTAALLSLGAASCLSTLGGGGGGSRGGSGSALPASFGDRCGGDFGADATAHSFKSFLRSTSVFVETAAELDRELLGACREMGRALMINPLELNVARPGESATQSACTRVAERLREEVAAVRAARGPRFQLTVNPPVCTVRVDEYQRCLQQCDTTIDPARLELRCEGGELRGQCSAQCTGRCAVEVHGQCGGSCEGTCQGGCAGVCNGVCEGSCASVGPDGRCNGACQGTCYGSCSASCQGRCEGRCEVSGQASCAGECRGGCSVQYSAPVCTGRVVPPQVRTECRTSCDTAYNYRPECTPGSARLAVDPGDAPDVAARAARLALAVGSQLGNVRAIAARLELLGRAGGEMVRTAGSLGTAVRSYGENAVFCSAAALAALPLAAAQVNVSVRVSVSITASVDAR